MFDSAAQTFQTDWQKCFGTPGYDEGYDVLKTESGYFVLGVTEQKDIWLGKTDFGGNILWEHTYGGTGCDYAARIIKLSSNSYIIAGDSYSSNGDISNDPYPNSFDYFIFNIDSMGIKRWDKIYGGNNSEVMYNACSSGDGGIILLGTSSSCDGDLSNCFGFLDFWILKVDSLGTKVWDLVVGSDSQDIPQTILKTSDNGFLIGGSTAPPFNSVGNITCQPYGPQIDILLLKIDSGGKIQWQKCFGGSYDDEAIDIVETESGYTILGYTSSEDGDLTNAGYHLGYVPSGSRTCDIWVFNTNLQGNLIWSKCYGGSSLEGPNRIFKTIKGYRVFGFAQSFDGDVQGNHSWSDDYSDLWTFEVDSVMNLLSNQCFGSYSHEYLYSGVEKLNDNEFVISGHTCSYDWICSGEYDILLFKITDTLGVDVHEHEINKLIAVFPNPAQDYIKIENNEQMPVEITITNMKGIIEERLTVPTGISGINIKHYSSGIYCYSYCIKNKLLTGKFIIE